MVISARKWARGFRLVLLFCVLTVLLYQFLALAQSKLRPADPYREPQGRAVKVFTNEAKMEESLTMAERLKRFYWYGE